MSRQFVLFVAIGGFAAGVNLVTRILLNFFMDFELAVVVAYPVGMTVAFLLNRRYVFDAEGGHAGGQYARFFLVNLVALAQIWVVSVGLALWLFPAIGFTWNADTVAHGIGLASPIVTSYLAHKHFSFRPKRAQG
ncbi:GtrA family protein [Aquabacter sp. CN5-332]|uniref:GtrA family protein n=1 Tax=Aquabacter sp. CN5-332 TaxID=3156608 RepID=UPI0032B31EC2